MEKSRDTMIDKDNDDGAQIMIPKLFCQIF